MTDPNLRFGAVDWQGGLRFSGSAPNGPSIVIDGDGQVAPGPVVTMLLAAASCTGSDMVGILEKQKVVLRSLRIEVVARRAEDFPKRIKELTLTFRLAGEGLTEAKATRAVELSLEKYCSVVLSLNPDIPIRTSIVVEE